MMALFFHFKIHTIYLDIGMLHLPIIYFQIIIKNWDYFYVNLETLHVTIAKLAFMFFNMLCYAISQLTVAHVYINTVLFFVTFAMIFFAKLHQIDNILRSKAALIRFAVVKSFMHHHTSTFRQVMIANRLISAMITMYMAMNFPSNLYLIMFFFVIPKSLGEEKNLGVYFFCLMLICIQLFGYLVIHVISALYTNRLHNHSKLLIQINVRRRFNALSSILKMAFYIEKFHTKRRYGYTYLNFGLITLKTFIEVIMTLAF